MELYDCNFYRGKTVLVTGHTGFKGTWLCNLLHYLGAEVYGYSVGFPTNPSLFEITDTSQIVHSVYGDIRDMERLKATFQKIKPEIVFHLAAQPIVLEGYQNPHYTYETNVMGTVNLLECIRLIPCVRSLVNITTDKVYENKGMRQGYLETDILDGYDPYSNSKSCSELVTHCYIKSFLKDLGVTVSTVRAGNVIGGGDFAQNRIVPDCVRGAQNHTPIQVRNANSVRPYQHVLEALNAYLMIAALQYENPEIAGSYNVGPDDEDCISTGELVNLFVRIWGDDLSWENLSSSGYREADFLKLDCSKLKNAFNWKPRWHIYTAIEKTVEWSKCWLSGENSSLCINEQITDFLNLL